MIVIALAISSCWVATASATVRSSALMISTISSDVARSILAERGLRCSVMRGSWAMGLKILTGRSTGNEREPVATGDGLSTMFQKASRGGAENIMRDAEKRQNESGLFVPPRLVVFSAPPRETN